MTNVIDCLMQNAGPKYETYLQDSLCTNSLCTNNELFKIMFPVYRIVSFALNCLSFRKLV